MKKLTKKTVPKKKVADEHGGPDWEIVATRESVIVEGDDS